MKKLMLVGLVSLPLVSGCATKMETGTALGALTGGALAYGLVKTPIIKNYGLFLVLVLVPWWVVILVNSWMNVIEY